jgi:hypothetical protein
MARKSHHTASTHASFYSTTLEGSEERLFEFYHAALGEPSFFQSTGTVEDSQSKQVSKDTIMKALKLIYGPQANFLDDSPEQLVTCCINEKKQHIHGATS